MQFQCEKFVPNSFTRKCDYNGSERDFKLRAVPNLIFELE